MLASIDRPELLASMCIVWIPLSVWVVSLVGWMITADIEFGQGMLGIVAALIIGFLTINPPHPDLPPLFVVAAWATLVLAPATRLVVNRALSNQIEVEAIERAYELLAEKPDNIGAKLKLARAAYNKGIRLHAIAIAEDALQGQNERLFQEEMRTLGLWKAAEPGPPSPDRIRCVECGIPNYPGTIFCDRCGSPFLLDYARGRFMKSGVIRRVLTGWLIAILAIIGIPTAAVALPPLMAAATIVVFLAVGAWLLFRVFREPAAERH